MHAPTHARTHTCTHAHMHTLMHAHNHARTHAHTHVRTHAHTAHLISPNVREGSKNIKGTRVATRNLTFVRRGFEFSTPFLLQKCLQKCKK